MPTPTYTLQNLGYLDPATTGKYPYGGVFLDGAGNLVGTTYTGGASGYGTVFQIANSGTASAPSYTTAPAVIATLNATSGGTFYNPSSLVADAKGNLYGEVRHGGEGYGTVIEIANTGTVAAPSYSATPIVLASFGGGTSGDDGTAGLSIDSAGNLLGMTSQGGTSGKGTVFELTNTGTADAPAYANGAQTLVSFDGTSGASPYFNGRLIADAAGNLIGTTSHGGATSTGTGAVFEIANTGTKSAPVYATTATLLASFTDGATDGGSPSGGVVADGSGNLFGTTSGGGASGGGTIYEIRNTGTASAPAYADGATTLASLDSTSGTGSQGTLLIDKAGNLYGVTASGGANSCGTVFELANTGSITAPAYTTAPAALASFDATNGDQSFSDLTVDGAGNLYGTGTISGTNHAGNVFELVAAAPAPTITGTSASNPTTAERPVAPFSTAMLTDPTAGATDTLTITLSGGGGTLSDGPGFQGTSSLASTGADTDTLTGSAQDITTELQSLRFTPTGGAPGTVSTTTFTLSDMTTANGFVVPTDSTTTVADAATPSTLAAPTLLAASDTGASNSDGLTNDATPTFTGTAQAGATVTIYDNGTAIGSGVATGGNYAIAVTSRLGQGANAITATQTVNAVTSARSLSTTVTLDTTPPVASSVTDTAAQGSGPTPIGIAAPSDNLTAAGSLAIAAGTLPSDGTVTLANGTPVVSGQALTTAQLTGLLFTPTGGAGASSAFIYSVTDGAGNVGRGTATLNVGAATLNVGAPTTPDAVSISPLASYKDGAFTLTGTASSASGVKGVEITAQVDGVATDLGAATLGSNGTFTFSDTIGAHIQGFITATETNNAGGTASAQAGYSLTGGLSAGKGEQDRYSADGSALTATGVFKADGSQEATVLEPGQTFASSFFDTFQNGGAPLTTFVFDPGFGRDTVDLFRVDGTDHDTLSFKGSDYGNDIATVLASAKNTSAGLLITDPTASSPGGGPGTHDTLLLKGITKQQLAANQGDIAFHA